MFFFLVSPEAFYAVDSSLFPFLCSAVTSDKQAKEAVNIPNFAVKGLDANYIAFSDHI